MPPPSSLTPAVRPAVSVILVSDYAAGDSRGWDDLRGCLTALARQDCTEPVEFLVSENEQFADAIPSDLLELIPSLRVVTSPHTGSCALKNHCVTQARADLIAILDADCSPDPHWLANILAAFRAHPEASVISGRTTYKGRNTTERVHALLSRSYLDTVHEGNTLFISSNNAAWKREVYLDHPLPTDSGPFATRIQSESVRRAGGKLRFDPSIFAVHVFEGWDQEADIRRNTGFGTVISRLHDPRLPYARLIGMGRAAIPFVVAGKTWNAWRDCLRCWRAFGLRAHELPLAMALAPVLIGLETGGMWAAYGNGAVGGSAFR